VKIVQTDLESEKHCKQPQWVSRRLASEWNSDDPCKNGRHRHERDNSESRCHAGTNYPYMLVGRVLRSFTSNCRSRILGTPRQLAERHMVTSEGYEGLEGGMVVSSSSMCASRMTGVCEILVGLRLCHKAVGNRGQEKLTAYPKRATLEIADLISTRPSLTFGHGALASIDL
jgi:hypothetical protein